MAARQFLAVLLVLLLAVPAFGEPSPVGNVTSSEAAFVRGTGLTTGSTVFSGDTIEVRSNGNALIALSGGGQIQVGENSQISLLRTRDKVQLAVDRGIASFRTAETSSVESILADATIRAAGPAPSVGIVQVKTANAAVIAAQKGALLINTAHDGKTITVPEGDALEVTLAPDPEPSKQKPAGTAVPAGASATKVLIFGVILVGAASLIGYAIARHVEGSLTPIQKCNAVSPFKCP